VSRPERGVVDEETCPIVRARGCSAGFIGTGVLSAAPPKFRPDQSGAVLGASALSRAHFCERYSGSDREGGYSKISESFRAFYYREVPALALSPNHLPLRKKPDIVFFDKPRGPCAGIIDQPPLIPAAVNKGSLRWHHRPATPRLTAPAHHRRRS
jgi:hypothetical protein